MEKKSLTGSHLQGTAERWQMEVPSLSVKETYWLVFPVKA